jgi:hypothetical protein
MSRVLLIASLVVFILACIPVGLPVNPIALGLGLYVGSKLT